MDDAQQSVRWGVGAVTSSPAERIYVGSSAVVDHMAAENPTPTSNPFLKQWDEALPTA